MREIKFRAWDKDRRCFIPCIVGNTDIQDDKWICPLTFCEVNGVKDWYHNDTCEVMQYTGLYDNNCKEVYEGDIIKSHFGDEYGQVKCGSYQSCFDSKKKEHVGFYIEWSSKYSKNFRKDIGYWIHMVDVCVVGNIYENPELLEVD